MGCGESKVNSGIKQNSEILKISEFCFMPLSTSTRVLDGRFAGVFFGHRSLLLIFEKSKTINPTSQF